MNATFAGTIQRDGACWDAEGKVWYQDKIFDVQRDTTVWLFYSATDDADFIVADLNGRTLNRTTLIPTKTGRRYHVSGVRLRRGQYFLQIQAARLRTRFTARPHYGTPSATATGLCHRSSAPGLTSNSTFSLPLAQVAPGMTLACIDPDGRAAVIRRVNLDAPTDVAFELRARDAKAKSAIHLSGPGHRNVNFLTAVSPRPGDPARLTLPLGRGTYYVVFASDAETTISDGSVRKTPSTTTAPFPTTRNPGCETPARLPLLDPGRSVAGRITSVGSCGLAAGSGWPGGGAEVYRLSIPERRKVAIAVESRSFAPAIAIFSTRAGTALATEANSRGALELRMPLTLEAGDYFVAVGHARPTEIGSFVLTVRPD